MPFLVCTGNILPVVKNIEVIKCLKTSVNHKNYPNCTILENCYCNKKHASFQKPVETKKTKRC